MKFAVVTLVTCAVLFNWIDDVRAQDMGMGGGMMGGGMGGGMGGSMGGAAPMGSTAAAPKKDEDFIHQLKDKVTKNSFYRHLRHPILHLECKHHITKKGCPVHKKRKAGMGGMGGMEGGMGGMGGMGMGGMGMF